MVVNFTISYGDVLGPTPINPREQHYQVNHSDIIKNSILQLNSIMNCSLKAGI